MSRTINAPDRLRLLIDRLLTAAPGRTAADLAEELHFSRDHLDRLLSAATGETPAGLRRRLLLERAAWELEHGATAADAAASAGFGSTAAFSRAFSRAHGAAPTRHRGGWVLDAPNGIHFHPPSGLLVPSSSRRAGRHGLADRMLAHHLDRVGELLGAAEALPPEALARPLRPGFVAVWFEGEEPSASLMLERLVCTTEVWAAAIAGERSPERVGPLGPRLRRSAASLTAQVREIDRRGGWDDAFVDALCEPPQTFTLGAVLSHVLAYGALRRETLAGVLRELGARVGDGDPIMWELRARRRT